MELVIEQSLLFRTAVFWALQEPRDKLVELAINSLLDSGFLMRDGLNVARLHYDRDDRWWKWGEKMTDPTGALVVTSAPAWDGCVVAFSGRQRFHLEFRLRGRRDPVIFLHEREAAYAEQIMATESAMSLARVLDEPYRARWARDTARFPWPIRGCRMKTGSLLCVRRCIPIFSCFLKKRCRRDCLAFAGSSSLKIARCGPALPMKGSPMEVAFHRSDEELNRNRLRQLNALGEKYYDQMYESRHGANGCYSSAKDAFYDAIGLANELGMKEEAEALSKRLEHIKAVFRSQFT